MPRILIMAIETGTYNLIDCGYMCFEKRPLMKKQLPLCYIRQQFKFVERFSELIKKKSFKYATLSIKKIILVSIALLIMCKVWTF